MAEILSNEFACPIMMDTPRYWTTLLLQGIRAALSIFDPSCVVIGGDDFQTFVIRRNPQHVAFRSPINATGVFELVDPAALKITGFHRACSKTEPILHPP